MAIVISPNLVGGERDILKSCTAIIGYRNHVSLNGSIITASSEADGFPASAVATPMTYERWLARSTDTNVWLKIDLGSQYDADYVGVGAHGLADGFATMDVHYSNDDVEWFYAGVASGATSSAVMLLTGEVTARYWRFELSSPAEIGVVYIGKMLMMPVQMYGGHSPITLSRQTDFMPNRSVTGQFLGRSVVRQGLASSYTFRHIPATWYRANFEPFVQAAIRNPFFIAWNPISFPDEVAYAWCNDDIAPINMGIRGLMEVSFDAEAIG